MMRDYEIHQLTIRAMKEVCELERLETEQGLSSEMRYELAFRRGLYAGYRQANSLKTKESLEGYIEYYETLMQRAGDRYDLGTEFLVGRLAALTESLKLY